ncbi:MAG: D-alanyl-D-alanine carboxypeptidase family protein [Gaiellaceae bacterium]
MKRLLLVPALVALAFLPLQPVAAAAPGSTLPAVDARAYLVVNAATGDVLASKNAGARLPIASLTKLMTVDVALQHLSLDRYVAVSAAAAETGEESAGLRTGERILVGDLVRAALIQSANDAADALADAASGGHRALFISWMNAEAKRLGLTHTHFARPDGLDAPDHYSSARDITTLAKWVMGLPEVRQTVRLRRSTISGGRVLTTWNDLLGTFPGVVGVKTGHTDDAGWCQVALLERDGIRVYATILGSPSRERRNSDLAGLLRFALTSYKLVQVVAAGDPLEDATTAYGGSVPVAATSSLTVPLRLDRVLSERLILPRTISLPVKRGQHLGEVRVYSNGKLVGKSGLVALRSAAKPGPLGKTGWYAGQALRDLVGWI